MAESAGVPEPDANPETEAVPLVLLVDDDHDVLGANARFLRVNAH